MDSDAVEVARGASYLIISDLITNAVGLAYFGVKTRFLGQIGIGLIAGLGVITTLFEIFAVFALPSAISKFISEELGKNNWKRIRRIFHLGLSFGLLIFCSVIIVTIFGTEILGSWFLGRTDLGALVSLSIIDAALAILIILLRSCIYGLKRLRDISVLSIGRIIGRIFLGTLFLYMGYGVLGVIYSWIIVDLCIVFVYITLCLKAFKGSSESFPLKKVFNYSLPVYVKSIMLFFSAKLDFVLLLKFFGAASLGVYSPAIAAVGVVSVIPNDALSSALFPHFSAIFGKSNLRGLKKVSEVSTRYIALICIPLAVGAGAVSLPAIQLVFGSDFLEGWYVLSLLSFLNALLCLNASFVNVIASAGWTRRILESGIAEVAVFALVCYIFIPFWGISGAVLARVLGGLSSFIYVFILLRKSNLLSLDMNAYMKALISAVFMAGAILGLELITGFKSSLLIVYIAFGVFTYLIGLKILKALNEIDLSFMRGFLPQKMSPAIDLLGKFLVE